MVYAEQPQQYIGDMSLVQITEMRDRRTKMVRQIEENRLEAASQQSNHPLCWYSGPVPSFDAPQTSSNNGEASRHVPWAVFGGGGRVLATGRAASAVAVPDESDEDDDVADVDDASDESFSSGTAGRCEGSPGLPLGPWRCGGPSQM